MAGHVIADDNECNQSVSMRQRAISLTITCTCIHIGDMEETFMMRRIRLMGLNKNKLADLVGTSLQQMGKLASRPTLTKEWAEKCAPHLGCASIELVMGREMGPLAVPEAPTIPVNLEGASRSEAEMELYHLLRSRGVPQDDVKQLIAEIAKLIPGWPR